MMLVTYNVATVWIGNELYQQSHTNYKLVCTNQKKKDLLVVSITKMTFLGYV